jgi:hypothetical protein
MKWWLLLALTGCATTGALTSKPEECESFAEFDARTRERLDTLLAEAPGDLLVRESSRLNTARRTCARHVIGGLREAREREGIEAVQRELDAMTATYGATELRALMKETLGADADQLQPLLVEASQRTTRQAGSARAEARDGAELAKLKVDAPNSTSPEPEMPETMCDAPKACERLHCLVENHASLELTARACLTELQTVDRERRTKGLGELLSLLPSTPSAARTETLSSLETLRQQQWPQVEAALTAKHPGRAAQLAAPFRALPNATAKVEALREAAKEHHLARAKELASFPEAAWLHRKLAETFGAPEAPALVGAGKWAPVRWRCPGDMLTPPALPVGLDGVLTVRCPTPAKTKPPKDAEATFDLEREMANEKVTGSLTITCAEKPNLNSVNADGVASLPRELERLIELNIGTCTRLHGFAAVKSCGEINQRSAADVITRFVGHVRFTRKWETCFVEWLEATEGVAPPPVPSRATTESQELPQSP